MSEGTGSEAQRIVKVLDHPARRRIIELLGTRGPLPWKELASEIGMGTGALYYHLDALDGIVVRGMDKKYSLTKTGRLVFSYLQTNTSPTAVQNLPAELAKYGWGRRLLEGTFAPRSLVNAITATPIRSVASLALISALILSLLAPLGYGVRLLFISPSGGTLSTVTSYLLSVAALVTISYIGSAIAFKARPNLPALAASASLALVPVVAFSSSVTLLRSAAGLSMDRNIFTVLLVFFQGWSASLLGAGISVSSGVRVEKTILVSLAVLYATMVIIFVQGAAA
jgi:hypothetical protein